MDVCIKMKREIQTMEMHQLLKSTIIVSFTPPPINLLQRGERIKTENGSFQHPGTAAINGDNPKQGNIRQTPGITSKAMALKPRIKHSASPSLMYLFGGMPKPFNVRTRGTKSLCDTATRQQMYKTGNKNRPCR